ncbi:hypothetical protein ACFQ51_22460 [Streptomyces kaempferi]
MSTAASDGPETVSPISTISTTAPRSNCPYSHCASADRSPIQPSVTS